MEDWADDIDLTIEQADHLNNLDDLRVEDPILWAMVQGVRTSRSIAARICWPHDYTLFRLREYKSNFLVEDSEGKRSIEWRLMGDYHRELASWVHAQKGTGGLFLPEDRNDE